MKKEIKILGIVIIVLFLLTILIPVGTADCWNVHKRVGLLEIKGSRHFCGVPEYRIKLAGTYPTFDHWVTGIWDIEDLRRYSGQWIIFYYYTTSEWYGVEYHYVTHSPLPPTPPTPPGPGVSAPRLEIY